MGINKVLDEARVYRLESFASLTAEFCKSIIPLATTSLEKQQEEEVNKTYQKMSTSVINKAQNVKDDEQRQKKKLKKKQQKKDLERVANNDFTELMQVLNIS